jgi:hypothetical protein
MTDGTDADTDQDEEAEGIEEEDAIEARAVKPMVPDPSDGQDGSNIDSSGGKLPQFGTLRHVTGALGGPHWVAPQP